MKAFDKDEDGLLDTEDFIRMVVPKDENYAKIILGRKPYNEGFPVVRSQVFTP
jgi:hypothetical protein